VQGEDGKKGVILLGGRSEWQSPTKKRPMLAGDSAPEEIEKNMTVHQGKPSELDGPRGKAGVKRNRDIQKKDRRPKRAQEEGKNRGLRRRLKVQKKHPNGPDSHLNREMRHVVLGNKRESGSLPLWGGRKLKS